MSEKINSEIFLIRHGYDDHSYIDGKNDTSLIERGVEGAKTMAKKMVPILYDAGNDNIMIRTSCKKRAVETTEILSEELEKNKIPHHYEIDDNLRELYQGKLLKLEELTHDEKIIILQAAWEIFDDKRIKGEMNYHFGDPDTNNTKADLLKKITQYPFGESQNEFSLRLGRAMRNIAQGIVNGELPIVITHRGGIREIQNLLYSVNNSIPFAQSQVCEMAALIYCDIIRDIIKDPNSCLEKIDKHLDEIEKKIDG